MSTDINSNIVGNEGWITGNRTWDHTLSSSSFLYLCKVPSPTFPYLVLWSIALTYFFKDKHSFHKTFRYMICPYLVVVTQLKKHSDMYWFTIKLVFNIILWIIRREPNHMFRTHTILSGVSVQTEVSRVCRFHHARCTLVHKVNLLRVRNIVSFFPVIWVFFYCALKVDTDLNLPVNS